MRIAKTLTAVAAAVAVLATPFVGANAAHAKGKSLKCYATKVAGTVATYTWTCSATRP